MSKIIEAAAREIILKVKDYCEKEKRNGGPLIPFKNVRLRVAALTGVSERTVSRITKEGEIALLTSQKLVTPGKKKPRKYIRPLENLELCMIRRKIHEFYVVKKEVPTLPKLMNEIKKDINFHGNRKKFKTVVYSIGFKFKKCKLRRRILTERYDLIAGRLRYLDVIRLYRENESHRPIIYIGEMCIPLKHINSGDKTETQTENESLVIIHAGSQTGFVRDACIMYKSVINKNEYMNAVNFKKWIVENLLPNLPENSILVMDSALHHCEELNKAPTMTNRIGEMHEWLRERNIEFTDNMRKAELYEMIKIHKGSVEYEIDQLLAKYNHSVIRLPPYHWDLNAIELIWKSVRSKFIEKYQNMSNEVFNLVRDVLNEVSDSWKAECDRVAELEREYQRIDGCLDQEMDSLIVSFDGDRSSDSNTESESEPSDLEHNDHTYY